MDLRLGMWRARRRLPALARCIPRDGARRRSPLAILSGQAERQARGDRDALRLLRILEVKCDRVLLRVIDAQEIVFGLEGNAQGGAVIASIGPRMPLPHHAAGLLPAATGRSEELAVWIKDQVLGHTERQV